MSGSKMCGKCVCSDCITSLRQLSRQDKKTYPVCDTCDNKISNQQAENELNKRLKSLDATIAQKLKQVEDGGNSVEDYNRKLEQCKKMVLKLIHNE